MHRWAPAASLAAAALAALAAVVASEDGDADIVPFFVGLTLAGGLHAWSLTWSWAGARVVAWGIAAGWLVAAIWIGVLLGMWQYLCACSSPPRPPEATYLGMTATIYHLLGVYGGALLVLAGTRASRRTTPAASPEDLRTTGR